MKRISLSLVSIFSLFLFGQSNAVTMKIANLSGKDVDLVVQKVTNGFIFNGKSVLKSETMADGSVLELDFDKEFKDGDSIKFSWAKRFAYETKMKQIKQKSAKYDFVLIIEPGLNSRIGYVLKFGVDRHEKSVSAKNEPCIDGFVIVDGLESSFSNPRAKKKKKKLDTKREKIIAKFLASSFDYFSGKRNESTGEIEEVEFKKEDPETLFYKFLEQVKAINQIKKFLKEDLPYSKQHYLVTKEAIEKHSETLEDKKEEVQELKKFFEDNSSKILDFFDTDKSEKFKEFVDLEKTFEKEIKATVEIYDKLLNNELDDVLEY